MFLAKIQTYPVGIQKLAVRAAHMREWAFLILEFVWFIAAALGSLVARLVAAQLETLAATTIFMNTAIFAGATGLLALLVSPGVRKLMGNVT